VFVFLHASELVVVTDSFCSEAVYVKLYLAPIRGLVSQCQINTDKCSHTLLSSNCIKAICHPNMFQPLKGHLQGG